MAANTDPENLQYQLLCLEDPVVLPAHKLRATAILIAGGKLSLPLLIERLANPEDVLFMEELLVPTGVMNPGPPRAMAVTLKFQIENILYEILYPEQAPRPELRGEPVGIETDTKGTGAPSPVQTLAQMKADWENARDQGIDRLAPTELGGAYAFVQDWTSFWDDHGHKELEDLKKWSREQVKHRWAMNMANTPLASTQAPGTNPGPLREPPANIPDLRKVYERAWALFEGARKDPAKKAIASKALQGTSARNPELKPHIDYLLSQLA